MHRRAGWRAGRLGRPVRGDARPDRSTTTFPMTASRRFTKVCDWIAHGRGSMVVDRSRQNLRRANVASARRSSRLGHACGSCGCRPSIANVTCRIGGTRAARSLRVAGCHAWDSRAPDDVAPGRNIPAPRNAMLPCHRSVAPDADIGDTLLRMKMSTEAIRVVLAFLWALAGHHLGTSLAFSQVSGVSYVLKLSSS